MTNASSASDLIQSIDIVEEVSKFVKLKNSKNELLGLCPFHSEDTPSFYVNPSKQLFFCFGCQQGGNVITFKSKISGLTLQDAVQALAKEYHINLKDQPKVAQYKDTLSLASNYYKNMLSESPEAMGYLQKRNLSQEMIDSFEIGFSPNQWSNLKHISGFNVNDAMDIGLIIRGEKGNYDRFRHRVMFPIRSHQGQLVGFGGRALGDAKPKYINSSESHIYHKSQVLYGLYHALKSNEKHLLVVEGYMDVISLHQAGFKGAVAALGTAFTVEQFQLIAKYAEKVTFCFDGDIAGQKAAQKAFYTILPHLRDQLSCYFLLLPEGDPDDYIQKHSAEQFATILETATPLSDYLLTIIVPKTENSLEDSARYTYQVKEILSQMPNSILKRLLEKKIGIQPQLLRKKASIKQPNIDVKCIKIILSYPMLIQENKTIIEPLILQLPAIVQKAFKVVFNNTSMSLAMFLEQEGIEASNIALQHQEDALVAQELSDLLKHYQIKAVDLKIQTLLSKKMNEKDSLLLQELLQVKHLLKKKKITLAIKEI